MQNLGAQQQRGIERGFERVDLSVYHCSLKVNSADHLRDFIYKLIEASGQKLKEIGIEIGIKTFSPTEHKDQCKPGENTYWPKAFTLKKANEEVTDIVYGTKENVKSIIWLSEPIYEEIVDICTDDEIETCSIRSLGENSDFSRELRLAIEDLFAQIEIDFDENVENEFLKQKPVLLKKLDPKYDPDVRDIMKKRLR